MADEVKPTLVPLGYGKLPTGVRCRCIKLWTDGVDHYCCKGAPPMTLPSARIDELRWRSVSEPPVAISVISRFYDDEMGDYVYQVIDPGMHIAPGSEWLPLSGLDDITALIAEVKAARALPPVKVPAEIEHVGSEGAEPVARETFIQDEEGGIAIGILIDMPDGTQIWSGAASNALFEAQDEGVRDELAPAGQFVVKAPRRGSPTILCQVADTDTGIEIARAVAAYYASPLPVEPVDHIADARKMVPVEPVTVDEGMVTDTTALRETLRAYGGNNTLDYRHRAASAIERLEAERDEARGEATAWANASLEQVGTLRAERDEAHEQLARAIMRLPSGYGEGERGQGLLDAISGLRRRVEAAEAQRDQLAEALRIAEAVLRNHPTPFSTTDGGAIPLTSASEAAERARAALDHAEGVE